MFLPRGKTSKHIMEVVDNIESEFGQFATLRDADWEKSPDDHYRLSSPLPRRMFRRPIAELYGRSGSWSYLSLFHPLVPQVRHAPAGTSFVTAYRFTPGLCSRFSARNGRNDRRSFR